MTREPSSWLGWFVAIWLWIVTTVAVVFMIVFACYGAATYFTRQGAVNAERAAKKQKNQAEEAFWASCKKRIRLGIFQPSCIPSRQGGN
jgi:hypothetical protein